MEEKKIGEEGNARKKKYQGSRWGCPDEFISVS
jgi:hypothetical protein